MQYKISIRGALLSPENNVGNNDVMLRKIYNSTKLLKFVMGKMPNTLMF